MHLFLDEPHGPSAPLVERIAADAISREVPVIAVLLDQATPQFRAALERHGVDVQQAEQDGLIVYVDSHAHRVGWAHTDPATIFVEADGPDGLLLGLSEAQAGLIERAPEHYVLVDSLSSLLLLEGLNSCYRVVQALSSMAPRLGSISVGRIISGMHTSQETTALRHLATTVTDVSEPGAQAGASEASARGADDRSGLRR